MSTEFKNTSLGDLQQHLTKRLDEVKNSDTEVDSWMLVRIGDEHYVIPLEQLGEIIPWSGVNIKKIPYTKNWFLGVTYSRGNLIGVADFDQLLGKEKVKRSDIYLQSCNLLTINPVFQVNAGLLIDELQGLRASSELQRIVDDENKKASASFLTEKFVEKNGTVRQVLNLQNLIQDANFLQIRI